MSLVTGKHAIGVGCIVSNSNGEILLIKRKGSIEEGKWALPGGHVDFKEKLNSAIIREVKEETGVDIDSPKLFTYSETIRHDVNAHYIIFYFSAKSNQEEIKNCPDETHEAAWFSMQEIKKMNLAFRHNEIVGAFLTSDGIKDQGFLFESDDSW